MQLTKTILTTLTAFFITIICFAQQTEKQFIVKKDTISIKTDSLGRIMAGHTELDSLSVSQQKSFLKQVRRDTIRSHKKIWTSVLGGPSYTPDASFGVGGALLSSFKLDKNDSISYRSFLPIGFNISLNGTIVVAGAGTFFFNENKFRIYANYGYRNEPANYYGKGMEAAETTARGKETTQFHKRSFSLNPRFVWLVKPNLYVGGLFDINYTKMSDINPVMAEDAYFLKYKSKYTNIGLGGIVQYDTRDDVATPTDGLLLSATGKVYSRYFGGTYNYQVLDLEYRQFVNLYRRATLAWVARTQMSFGDVPLTELPSFGSPFDLRGYFLGQYRDKAMGYGIVEYRHMFGTQEDLQRGRLLSKFGFVAWGGLGTIGDNITKFNKWKTNYGVGLRIQIQPRKNFRIDVGKAQGAKGMQFYLNMTEAF